MNEELTKLVDIKDIVVGRCIARPIEDIKNNEDLKNLSDSIDIKGQLMACLVRPMGDKYELLAGGRRYVAMLRNHSQIEVKIKNVDDTEAMELGIVDNAHTKVQEPRQRDSQIYKVWKFGKKHGKYVNASDYAKKISYTERKVRDIIYAGEEAERKEYKGSHAIKNATTSELVTTKSLSDYPKLREKVIVLEQNKDMTIKDMKDVSKTIAKEIQHGTSEKIIDSALDIISPKGLDNVSSNAASAVIFEPEKFKETLNVMKTSPQDVQEAVVKGEISIEDAKEIGQHISEEKRTATIKEVKTVEKQLSAKSNDSNKKLILNAREKQRKQEITGYKKIKVDFYVEKEGDIQEEKSSEPEETFDEKLEKVFIEKYRQLVELTTSVLGTYHPKKMKTQTGRKNVIDIIADLSKLYERVLLETADIKNMEVVKRM